MLVSSQASETQYPSNKKSVVFQKMPADACASAGIYDKRTLFPAQCVEIKSGEEAFGDGDARND